MILLPEDTKSFADVVMYHFPSSVLFDVPGMPFHFEEDHRCV